MALEIMTPRTMDKAKKTIVSARGIRNMTQWTRGFFLGLVVVGPCSPQLRHVP